MPLSTSSIFSSEVAWFSMSKFSCRVPFSSKTNQSASSDFDEGSKTLSKVAKNRKIDTVGELKDSSKRYLWSKTTLIASSVSGAGVIPPFCKMGTFFHGSLALRVPIYRNFQSNGGK